MSINLDGVAYGMKFQIAQMLKNDPERCAIVNMSSVHGNVATDSPGASYTALVGLALAMLTLPLTAGASAPIIGGTLLAGGIGGAVVGSHKNAADDSWWKQELHLSPQFVREVDEAVRSCDSAIAIMLPQHDPGLADRFATYGGTLLRTELGPEQTELVRKRFAT